MKLYVQSMMAVGRLSLMVETGFFPTIGIPPEKRKFFFFIRGVFPFYLLSLLYQVYYFLCRMPQGAVHEWTQAFYATLFLKLILVCLLPLIDPSQVEVDRAYEQRLVQARPDMMKFRCRGENIAMVFRGNHCPHCRRCCYKFERHSYLYHT